MAEKETARNKLELIQYYRENPCIASSDILGIDLAPHQRLTMKAMWESNYSIICLTRGGGKTFMLALFAVLRALLFPGEKVGILAPTYRQSKFVFAEVEKIYEISPDFREACIKPPVRGPESCYLRLSGSENRMGSSIEALPLGDGGKIRGARFFTIICDEVAQIPRDILDIVIRGMMATTKDPMENVRRLQEQRKLLEAGEIDSIQQAAQNKIVFASTSYFQYNHLWERVAKFIEILLEKKKKCQLLKDAGKPIPEDVAVECRGPSPNHGQVPHRIMMDNERALVLFNYEDPPEGFMNQSSIDEARREMSDYMFKMEYCCFFPPDSEGFYPRSLLDKAREHRNFSCHLKAEEDTIYIAGVDPARSGDNFAIAIVKVDLSAKEVQLVRMLTYHKKSFPLMHSEIRKLMEIYNIAEIGMDSGGGGTTIRDLLANKDLCPQGQQLILQRGFDEHVGMKGSRILELIEFSKYEWLHDANHDMLSGLQHGTFKIASTPPCDGETCTPAKEDADEQVLKTLEEVQNIVVSVTGHGRMHWDTPMKHQRKDRYSAALIAHAMGRDYIRATEKPTQLASGFWS